jgi:branched-chain amino acid transport system substrate-binding protein
VLVDGALRAGEAEVSSMTRRYGPILAVVLALVAGRADAGDIKIGLANPLTGPLAGSGERNRTAIGLAIRRINAEGGVLGREVALVTADDACGTDQAAAAALELIKAGVVVVVGHLCSHSSLVAAAVYEAAGLPMISPDSTHPRLTEEGRLNVFRLGGRDDDQGRIAGDWLAAQTDPSLVAIVHDGSTYGKGLAERTRARLREHGVQERLFAAYPPAAADYLVLVAAVRRTGARRLYVGGYGPDAGRILRTARDQGYAVQMVGGDGLGTQEFRTAAAAAGDGTVFTARPDLRAEPEAGNVLDAFRALGLGDLPSGLGAYAGVQVWAEAARRAGTTSPAVVAERIRRGRFTTVLGPVAFDAKGDLVGAGWQWYQWRGGSVRPLDAHIVVGQRRASTSPAR